MKQPHGNARQVLLQAAGWRLDQRFGFPGWGHRLVSQPARVKSGSGRVYLFVGAQPLVRVIGSGRCLPEM